MGEPRVIWLNGALVEAAQARMDPEDRGLLLGDGLFETIAVRDGVVRDPDRHFARLKTGLDILRIALPLNAAALSAALNAVLGANMLREGVLRLTVTRGAGPRGLLPPKGILPTVMITAAALPPPGGVVSVVIAKGVSRDETSPLSAIKTLSYLPNILARIEAAERGADDALLRNGPGRLAEASAGNVFVRLEDKWLTPAVSEGALPGVRRARLIDAGMAHEANIQLADLFLAKAVCIGNVLGLRTVFQIDGRAIGVDQSAVTQLAAI
jgi:branched-chain amino acid aminotransferase